MASSANAGLIVKFNALQASNAMRYESKRHKIAGHK